MKGAVKKNISPPTGHPDTETVMAASPASVETIGCSGKWKHRIVRHYVVIIRN
jgi:hypothetical protein